MERSLDSYNTGNNGWYISHENLENMLCKTYSSAGLVLELSWWSVGFYNYLGQPDDFKFGSLLCLAVRLYYSQMF